MNELHEKLLAQAHIEFAPDSKAVTARFAELIVRECAAHLNFVGDEYAGIELLEHFGVEE